MASGGHVYFGAQSEAKPKDAPSEGVPTTLASFQIRSCLLQGRGSFIMVGTVLLVDQFRDQEQQCIFSAVVSVRLQGSCKMAPKWHPNGLQKLSSLG